MSDEPDDPDLPTELDPTLPLSEELFDGRYRIVKLLGEGGFGKVFVVEDILHDDEQLALKLVKPEHADKGDFAQRFRNEIRVLRQMQHEGIPQIFNDGQTPDGEVYFTMAFVRGPSLEDVLRDRGRLDPLTIARYVRQMVGILEYAHSRGVVHRDLKPGNILVVEKDGEEQLKILDFGIAKILQKEGALEKALTMETQMPIGTPHYMAPEQVRGRDVDGRTDLYALGIIIYRMVSGRYPFEGGTAMEILAARLQDEPTPLVAKDGPDWLVRLVRELLQREKEKRPSTERIADLLVQAVEERRETNNLLRWGLVLGAVAAVAIVLALWRPWEEPEVSMPRSTPVAGLDGGAAPTTGAAANDGSSAGQDSPATSPDGGASELEPPAATEGGEVVPSEDANGSSDDAGPPADPLRGGDAGGETELPAADDAADDAVDDALEGAPPAIPVPAPPSVVEVQKLHPGGDATLSRAFGDTVDVTATVDRALASARVNGVDATLRGGGLQLEAKVPYDVLAAAGGKLSFELVGVNDLERVETREITVPPMRVPGGSKPAPGAGYTETGWASAVVTLVGDVELVHVPVEGAPYYVGRHEVTWAQYDRFRAQERPSSFDPDDDHPAVGMSWEDARAFCRWAGAVLPTLEEWLGAASRGTAYPWGDEWVPGRCNAANEASRDGYDYTSPAAESFGDEGDVSWCGAVGLAGNVAEWVDDDGERALVGGSFTDDAEGCRLAKKFFAPSRGASHFGFRIALRTD